MAKLAFFGLGAMGEGMAANLLQAGHTVNITVHRAREPVARLTELGATTHTTKPDAADASDVIFLCLPNADVSNAVINEIWPALSTRHMIIDTGTLSVGAATQLAERLAEHGIEFVESPVAGGQAQAAAGELGAFVGCSDTAFEKAAALLDHFCVNIQHYGPVGRASGAKLISNYLVLGMVRLIIETFHAADALEIDWTKLYETIRRGSANSGALQRMIGGIVADGTYDGYVFSVANASKDLRYIAQLANDAALPALSDAALKLFEQADQLGFGDLTVSDLLRKELRAQLTELTDPLSAKR